MEREAKFSELADLTLSSVVMNNGKDEIVFTAGPRKFIMYHSQNCCERVTVEDVVGDFNDLIGFPILQAEESTDSTNHKPNSGDESFTWTFYRISTMKGQVVIRWYGSSNGYYSESVAFKEVIPDHPVKKPIKPKKQPQYFTRPNGKVTESVDFYLKEWRQIIRPLEKLTGMKVIGFDPGFLLVQIKNRKTVQGATVNIPMWFAKILVEKFQSLNESLFINVYK
jgi:hypothetical protein